MLLVYGLGFKEALFIIIVVAIISIISGVWAGKKLFGKKTRRKRRK
jgi:hypothetical protein